MTDEEGVIEAVANMEGRIVSLLQGLEGEYPAHYVEKVEIQRHRNPGEPSFVSEFLIDFKVRRWPDGIKKEGEE